MLLHLRHPRNSACTMPCSSRFLEPSLSLASQQQSQWLHLRVKLRARQRRKSQLKRRRRRQLPSMCQKTKIAPTTTQMSNKNETDQPNRRPPPHSLSQVLSLRGQRSRKRRQHWPNCRVSSRIPRKTRSLSQSREAKTRYPKSLATCSRKRSSRRMQPSK